MAGMSNHPSPMAGQGKKRGRLVAQPTKENVGKQLLV